MSHCESGVSKLSVNSGRERINGEWMLELWTRRLTDRLCFRQDLNASIAPM